MFRRDLEPLWCREKPPVELATATSAVCIFYPKDWTSGNGQQAMRKHKKNIHLIFFVLHLETAWVMAILAQNVRACVPVRALVCVRVCLQARVHVCARACVCAHACLVSMQCSLETLHSGSYDCVLSLFIYPHSSASLSTHPPAAHTHRWMGNCSLNVSSTALFTPAPLPSAPGLLTLPRGHNGETMDISTQCLSVCLSVSLSVCLSRALSPSLLREVNC